MKPVRLVRATPAALSWSLALGFAASALCGCEGHEARTLRVRSALDGNRYAEALDALDAQLDVKNPNELPKDASGDNALLVLDRATVQQAAGNWEASKRDYQLADKSIDILDLSRNAGDTLGQYLYSDSAGKYRAPPTERLLVNTMNLVNYLETGDTQGALVEARRFSVMVKFTENASDTELAAKALGSLACSIAYERDGNWDEAARYFDDATRQHKLAMPKPRAPRSASTEGEVAESSIVLFVGFGRVPHKIANRVPIGLALTLTADSISPADRLMANRLAAQGLVTWVNYPSLAPEQGEYEMPDVRVDGQNINVYDAFNLSHDVRAEWDGVQGRVVGSAITRTITRAAAGIGIQAAAGKQEAIGILASLATQAVLTGLDTPDTRSWETLPARVFVARVPVSAGKHVIEMVARGRTRKGTLDVPAHALSFASLFALR